MKAPQSYTPIHPRFNVPNWKQSIPAQQMVRHFFITGETGSGKTVSAVNPLLTSILRYPEPEPYAEYAAAAGSNAEPADLLRPALLVIDPKQELEPLVRREAGARRVISMVYGQPGPVPHLFEGLKLEASAAFDFILKQSKFFTMDQERGDDPIWNMQAASLIRDFVAVDMWAAEQGELEALWLSVARQLEKHSEYASFIPLFQYNRKNYFQPIATLLAISADDCAMPLATYLDACVEIGVPGALFARVTTVVTMAHTTRSGVIWMANGILDDLSSEELASCVSLNPIEPPEESLCVQDSLNRGDAVIYVPTENTAIADLIGRCLKSKFFEFAFKREVQKRGFFYVVDEAHRFVSSGEQDGEQGLLDRCRAYRTGVVLATQSYASMAYRLEQKRGWTSLQIIVNNSGTALFFRSTDTSTQDDLMKRIPHPPMLGRPHVLQVRPLSSMKVGQCYALRPDGTWGIISIAMSE